jgi:flagellar basal-body rod modification protein FlgD
MLNVKSSTRTWSPAPQVSSLKGDGAQSLSATERDTVLGDQNIGEYLNKVADPNWVDPNKMRQVGNNELDKDAFLKLFLAQLKNQDPTNPMEGHELAAQLAQFTQLEKLNNIDTGIAKMSEQADPNKGFEAMSMIGKGVGGDSSKIFRSDEKAVHDIGFVLPASATEVDFSIRDANGQEVKKLMARELKPGPNKITWDGRLDNGTNATSGEYNVVISAKNMAGQKMVAETRFQGQVTGINFTPEGPVLMVGAQSVRMRDVKRIFDPRELEKSLAASGPAPAKTTEVQIQKGAEDLASQLSGMGGKLESVAMNQGLVNKLQKNQEGDKP